MMGLLLGLRALTAPTLAPAPLLWYEKPTTKYMSGLPIGNGRIGARSEDSQARPYRPANSPAA